MRIFGGVVVAGLSAVMLAQITDGVWYGWNWNLGLLIGISAGAFIVGLKEDEQ